MKLIICVFIFLFKYATAWGRGDLEKYGPFQLALNSKLIKCMYISYILSFFKLCLLNKMLNSYNT